jgi:hypothetical protein
MKPKKDNNRSIGAITIVGAAFLILSTVYLINLIGSPENLRANNTYTDNVSWEPVNESMDCPDSSSGIPLCELSAGQREKEELMDRLNEELARMRNGTEESDPYAPVKKPAAAVIISTNSVRLKVGIPASDHASLIAEDLKNAAGVSDIYWSPPDLFDIKYDAARTSVDVILSRDIFRRYNASVVSSI